MPRSFAGDFSIFLDFSHRSSRLSAVNLMLSSRSRSFLWFFSVFEQLSENLNLLINNITGSKNNEKRFSIIFRVLGALNRLRVCHFKHIPTRTWNRKCSSKFLKTLGRFSISEFDLNKESTQAKATSTVPQPQKVTCASCDYSNRPEEKVFKTKRNKTKAKCTQLSNVFMNKYSGIHFKIAFT